MAIKKVKRTTKAKTMTTKRGAAKLVKKRTTKRKTK
jgi:hypothetical protein